MKEEEQTKPAEQLREAFQSITMHGLPRLLQDSLKYMKAFWFLMFIGAAGCMAVLINARIHDYQKHEVYMKSKSRIMQPLPFPAVTVCNSDRFSGKWISKLPLEGLVCNRSDNSDRVISGNATYETEFNIACKMFLTGYKDTLRFGGQNISPFPNGFDSSGGFYPCFTFNKNGLAKQKVNGAGMGLNLALFNDPTDTASLATANISRFDDQRRGILIQIHDPETEVSMNPATTIAIMPGHSHDIVISRKTISRKKHPFPSNCQTKETTRYKLTDGRYTRHDCIFSCIQMKLQKLCGNSLSQNKSASQMKCERDLYKQRPTGDCFCPEPCFEVNYPATTATNIWPRMFELKRIQAEFASLLNFTQNGTADTNYIQKRFAKVSIYYEELINTDETEEELYGISSLISEIGGLMGLFLGCSVISLAELLWLFGMSIRSIITCLHLHKYNLQKTTPKGLGNNVELGSVNGAL